MKKLRAYVGLDNRFVMCEKFPDDEDHAGLHDLLEDFVNYDTMLVEEPLEQGFYLLEFEIEQSRSWDGDISDCYLQLKSYIRLT